MVELVAWCASCTKSKMAIAGRTRANGANRRTWGMGCGGIESAAKADGSARHTDEKRSPNSASTTERNNWHADSGKDRVRGNFGSLRR